MGEIEERESSRVGSEWLREVGTLADASPANVKKSKECLCQRRNLKTRA